MIDEIDRLEDNEVDDPATQIRDDVAEFLAALSNETDTPKEFEQVSLPFRSSDVNFDSDAWIACVAAVQGWLRFDSELPANDIEKFAEALSIALGFPDQIDAIDRSTMFPRLTAVAVDRLRERAERAVRMQTLFADEFLSDGGTRESATRAWASGWDEADESEDIASPEPVSAKADTWRINEFVAQAQDGNLNLTPSYQRGDVWGTGARQLLIESVLRGIPLPSVILLQPSDGRTQLFEVVDGKQRLTSILRFVGKHPLAIDRVKDADQLRPGNGLVELFNSDYPKFKRAWKSLFNEPLTSALEEQYYFPFKLRTDDRGLAGEDLEPLRGKYYTQIKDRTIRVADQRPSVKGVFEGYSEYKVPVIVYSRASQQQIHEVFNLYNRQGTHLNAEEIRNAIFHELELTRATLVAAGDSDPRTPVHEIAPSIEEGWPEIAQLQATLLGYGFGESRYRRTKVLSWILATLLVESQVDRLPSTAKHIDALLLRVRNDKYDPLRDAAKIRSVFEWIAQSAEAHSAYSEAWAPEFKDGGTGTKWQELQLIGSLVGIAVAAAQLGGALDERLSERAPEIYEASQSWQRPEKTQTRTQWEFISRVAQGVVIGLGIDATHASETVRERFGSSGLESLWAVTNYDLAE
ncbi:DUF262 domain-containing protein [Microterricola pindariensis]|uniref:GmrSD restriction endonucleases N-terminal domain-containing protein n=1 Tax=Microterricola pindariensis TaxID=478010 RepID=A0ABX5AXI1_9MICO|nr:DUF262 domain-containing protein [Microterricola pindariensis]PPL19590.1 hypothetical protein GY24_05225 [Microterricola pindariensis]